MARKICCQCSLCTQMCPRNQLGLHVQPHRAMQAASYGMEYEDNGIHACSGCGVCSFFVCPFGLTPSSVMANAKNHLQEQGKRPVKTNSIGVLKSREYSHIPIKRLVARLGLSKYDVDAPLNEMRIEPDFVSIPTKMHIGVPAVPCVNVGEQVVEGQVIAEPPENKLGVSIHASINGVISSVADTMITIQR